MVENWILTRSGCRLSLSEPHLRLVCPCCPGRLLVFPIEHKLTRIEAMLNLGLPLAIHRRGAKHINPKALVTVNQDTRTHIARIQQMFSRRDSGLMHLCLNDFCHRLIGLRRWSGGDMGNHVRQRLFTRLGEMNGCFRSTGCSSFSPGELGDRTGS